MKQLPILCLALASFSLIACRSTSTPPSATQPVLKPAPPVSAAELSDLKSLQTSATLTIGSGQPLSVPYRVRAQDAQWVVELPGVRETVLEVRDGAQYVIGEREFSESVATAYTPALLLLPKRLEMDKPVTGESQVAITGLDGKPRDSGQVRYTIRLLGRQKIHTESGPAEVYVVQAERHMKLKLAEADIQIISRYRPGKGLVEQEVQRQTRVLGLIPARKHEQLTLKR